jgi:hypothetical protein
MAVILRPLLGVNFFRGHISLKNRTYCPLFKHDTTSFKGACRFIYLIEAKIALYGPRLHCEPGAIIKKIKRTVRKFADIAGIGAKFHLHGCYFSLNTKNIFTA